MARSSNTIRWGLGIQQSRDFKVAYNQGYDAAKRGLLYHQNPYKYGTNTYEAWAKGWNAYGVWRTK